MGAREQAGERQGTAEVVLHLEKCTYTCAFYTSASPDVHSSWLYPMQCLDVNYKKVSFIWQKLLQEPCVSRVHSGSPEPPSSPHLMSATYQQCWGLAEAGRPLWRRGNPSSEGASSFPKAHLQLLEKELGSQWNSLEPLSRAPPSQPCLGRVYDPQERQGPEWGGHEDRHPEFCRI